MRKKRRWVYECEYCGKRNRSVPHMKKHELHCTRNPDRECGCCDIMLEVFDDMEDRLPLKELKKWVSEKKSERVVSDYSHYDHETQEVVEGVYELSDDNLTKLRNLAADCPACILAALRQESTFANFDYKEEMKNIFSDVNQSNHGH